MKIIIATSVMAMISAGIYGVIDLSKDLHSGTMVQYEDEARQPEQQLATAFQVVSATHKESMKSASQTVADNAVKEKPKKEPAPEVEWTDVKVEYFSRSRIRHVKNYEVEQVALLSEAQADSAISAGAPKTGEDVTAVSEEQEMEE